MIEQPYQEEIKIDVNLAREELIKLIKQSIPYLKFIENI